jgi:hypothetical protein
MAEERKLLAALQAKEKSAVDKILADDFDVWSSDKDSPTPREDWIEEHLGGSANAFRIRHMAVREFGDTAVVSFLLERSQPLRANFIVDVWRQSEDKLAVRYECTAGKAAKPKNAPTGKE